MVAMQGQDLPAVLRAIAVRSAPGTTLDDVRAAFDAGELVRSWAMRGTLFVAAPDDLAVLHAATGERMRRQEWRMCEVRGIEQAAAELAADVLVDALADGPLPRPAMLAAWEAAGISTAGGRGYHLLALLAYDGLVRFGPFEGGRDQLLVGGARPAVADPEAALDDALARMVAARGPIDADDVAWWMGLPKVPVRAALERAAALGTGLEPVRVGDRDALVASGAAPGEATGVVLVPGFDEWILGYRDRSLVASREVLAAVVPGANGVFRPMVLVDGVAVGTWRIPAARSKASAAPVLEIVERVPAAVRTRIDRAVAAWPHR
ncbi:crosslink repair DNA glycosylase YcaQ family protein [Agrococcus citreus]|uniref:Crosslink repair DNA glycosylase YcaQ family protein n=2 Tax=Agrococcus citreus TaxID=84643 RepID=A0ABP4JRX1_9MICO